MQKKKTIRVRKQKNKLTRKIYLDNITLAEDEVVRIINKIANKLAYLFRFGYHDIDDMKQEARIFGWESLSNYDGMRPLEGFLWACIHNKLFNFKRDHYERLATPCDKCGKYTDKCMKYDSLLDCKYYSNWLRRNNAKKHLMNPIDIYSVDDGGEQKMSIVDPVVNTAIISEAKTIIEKYLPAHLRSNYIKLLHGVKLQKKQYNILFNILTSIIKEHMNE